MSTHELERWTISAAGYRAEVLEAGGGLGGLWHDGHPLVTPTGLPVAGGRGQLLVPWPNRIRDGRYEFAGAAHQLAISEPSFHNAIHGLTRWSAWRLLSAGQARVEVACTIVPQTGYPWELDVRATYVVSAEGLEVALAATNLAGRPAPFAAGMHPYLNVGVPVDDATLTLPAATRLLTDDRQLPLGTERATGDHDFRAGRRIGPTRLDDAWTDLVRDERGSAVVRLEGAWTVELHLGPGWRWVQAFTGDGLPTGAREAVAVEPMTAPADAFNSGTDLLTLEPGKTWSGSFRIAAA
jgi:aldose 1-epimerase